MKKCKPSKLLLLILAFPLFLFPQEIVKENGYYSAEIVKTFSVGAGGKLVLQTSSGDIDLQSWDKKNVEIREKLRMDAFTKEEAREIIERSQTAYSLSGNTIRIESYRGGGRVQRHYQVFLPAKFDLDIRTSNGDISGKGVNGFINLQSSNGDITLLGAAGEIEVKTSAGDLQLEDIDGPLDAVTSGGDVRLKNLGGDSEAHTSGGNILLLNAGKNVIVKTSGGEIILDKIGGNLIAHTSGGNIEVSDCAGQAEVHTSGGDIRIHSMGNRIDVHTSGGDISGSSLEGPVDAGTSGGDIELRNVRGAVDAATSAGDVEVEITLKDFKKDHRIRLETSSGNIRLTLPAKLPASISAEIRDAGGRWKRYDIYSDFPLTTESPEGWRGIRRKGDINGGGDAIILETSSGDIYIRKSE